MIIAELYDFLAGLNGGAYKGLVIWLFTLAALLSRPFSGKLADTTGRMPIIIFGTLISVVASFIYPFITTLAGFFLLRFFHGLSLGFTPTGTGAYIADTIPETRRGEALGYFGFFTGLGMAIGPFAGSEIAFHFSMNAMFYTAGTCALVSALMFLGMKETLIDKQRFHPQMLKVTVHEIFEPGVAAPALVLMFTAYFFGVVLTIIPDLSEHLGMKNKAEFYSWYTGATIMVRFTTGKLSDRYKRIPILKTTLPVLAAGMFLLAFANTPLRLKMAAVITGISYGIIWPTLMAWAIDLSDKKYRARALGTFYMALELGIGWGALVAGWMYSDQVANIPATFITAGVLILLALGYLFFLKDPVKKL